MGNHGRTSTGRGLKITGVALIIIGALLYAVLGGPDDNPAAIFALPFMIIGPLVYFRGRQHAAKAVAEGTASPIYDSKPDVLYLRSFRTDAANMIKVLASGFSTEEEQLADVLRPFGDMVAVGRPSEPLPMPGGSRIYASDAEWKNVVLHRMRSAPLVVIRAGTGAGLFWEVGQALSMLSPDKVLIFLFNLTTKDYAAFADEVRSRFRIALPAVGSPSLLRAIVDYRENPSKVLQGFVRFSDQWNPVFLPIPSTIIRFGYNDFKSSFNLALRPVFERHGVAWQPAKRF